MAMQLERRRQPSEGTVKGVVPASLATLDDIDTDSVGVFCWLGVRPLAGPAGFLDWRLCGALSRTIESGFFEGRRLEVMLAPAQGRLAARRIFAFGLGPPDEATPTILRHACRHAYEVLLQAGVRSFVLLAPTARGKPELEAAFLGALKDELPGRIDLVLVEPKA